MTISRRNYLKQLAIILGPPLCPVKIDNQVLVLETLIPSNNMIRPFAVDIPQHVLDDLRERLRLIRWPDMLEDSDWHYGANLSYMKQLTVYWLYQFNWRNVEKRINAYPNFLASIHRQEIHFLHIKGKGRRSMPLLITHGWPGSFLEMMDLIPLLTEDMEFSFDLVIPSVPGFGFSENPTKTGCNNAFVADLWHQLMIELGYEHYGLQGGDIGAGISTWLSIRHPENVIGLHLNYIPGSYMPYLSEGEKLSDEVLEFNKTAAEWSAREGAYAFMHATKPLTVAYGLNDSPVGLCAWIVEKFNGWSDNNGNIETAFTKDELLANVTLYWVTQTIHSSIRIYNENRRKPMVFTKGEFVNVPVGFAKFPKELPTPPRSYIEKGFNIQHWTEMPRGGHFAAAEQPKLLAKDIRDFFLNLS